MRKGQGQSVETGSEERRLQTGEGNGEHWGQYGEGGRGGKGGWRRGDGADDDDGRGDMAP